MATKRITDLAQDNAPLKTGLLYEVADDGTDYKISFDDVAKFVLRQSDYGEKIYSPDVDTVYSTFTHSKIMIVADTVAAAKTITLPILAANLPSICEVCVIAKGAQQVNLVINSSTRIITGNKSTCVQWDGSTWNDIRNVDFLNGLSSGNASGQIPVSNTTKNTDLNADMLDGYHAGNASGNVSVANGTVNTNLNADKLDGLDAGNDSGQIPVSNGTVNTNLNADKVDGYDAGNASGNVSVSNGTVNTNLNADMLDGAHIADFFEKSTAATTLKTPQVISNTDVRNIRKTGWYVGENLANGPLAASAGAWLYVHAQVFSSAYVHLTAYNLFEKEIWTARMNTGSWGGWSKMTNADGYISGVSGGNYIFANNITKGAIYNAMISIYGTGTWNIRISGGMTIGTAKIICTIIKHTSGHSFIDMIGLDAVSGYCYETSVGPGSADLINTSISF